MNIDELAHRHQYAYDGYELIDWYEAAFPFWRVQIRVLAQEDHPVPLVDQFVLRSVSAGLAEVGPIASILGVNQPIVYTSLDQLNRAGFLSIVAATEKRAERISLTDSGHELLQKLVFSQPVEDLLVLVFDATTGELQKNVPIRQYKELKASNLFQVSSYFGRIPSTDELDHARLAAIWDDARYGLPKYQRGRRLISALSVDNSYPGYRPMRVLLYSREDDGDVQVRVYDNAVRSPAHEDALRKMHSQGIRIYPAVKEQELEPNELLDFVKSQITEVQASNARRSREEKSILQQKIVEIEETLPIQVEQDEADDDSAPVGIDVEISVLKAENEDLKKKLQELLARHLDVEFLSMHEHRPKLLDVLRTAQKQVIIITPWLKSGAVNDELIAACKNCMERGVDIIIAFGFDRESDVDEQESLRRLQQLQKTEAGSKLRLKRLQESHAKVLLWDRSSMIVTSFNWLSFGGKVYQGRRRVEYGTLIRNSSLVEKMWNEKLHPLLASSSKA